MSTGTPRCPHCGRLRSSSRDCCDEAFWERIRREYRADGRLSLVLTIIALIGFATVIAVLVVAD